MMRAIRDYHDRTGYKIGYKPAGGIATAKDALLYLALVKDELGNEVENLYARFLDEEEMTPKLRRAVLVGNCGVNIGDVRRLWKRERGEDLSLASAAEMMFEADTEGFGELSLEAWLETLRSLHDSELAGSQGAEGRDAPGGSSKFGESGPHSPY